MRRLRAVGPAAFTQGMLFGPAGGRQRQLPPGRGFPPVLPVGGGYPVRPALPPGPPPPLQIRRGPQLALPAAGETSGRLIDAQGESARRAASGFKAYESAQGAVRKGQVPLNKSISEAMFIQGRANTQYQRFGALSSEWIGAASRGATTIQELGRQTAITIGKFGGWLVAGGLLFTALGAIRQIGTGAIKASSGVLELQRVVKDLDPELAKAQFRERAERFNVPIEIVSGAAFESGKVFKDQNDALEATEATLYAVKVGELEYAEASRYLNAILRGFNLEAKDSKVIFDQINAAQNEFGISIRDSAAGIAKAAGTYRAAGGDFNSLLAIIATAQKATGQSGQVVGTAIARAPNFLRQESNRKTLEGFGIDARQGIDEVIEQAFEKAQSLSGERLQELASAIFGPQYGARIGTPLLQNFEQYQEVLNKTSPEKARGSSQRELNILLGQFDELLKKIVTELEILGSNLEQAGFLDIFGAGVKMLGQFLSGVNSLLELFNSLPTPLRKTLAILTQLYATVKLLRHFNLGESFGEGTVKRRAFTSPDQFKKLYGEDLRGQIGALVNERERATVTASRAAIGLGNVERQAVVAEGEYARLVGVHGIQSQEALVQQQVVNRTQVAKNSAEERLLAAQLAEQEILVAQKIAEDKSTALAGARNEAAARGVAVRYGDTVSTTFNRPVTAAQAAQERGLRFTEGEGGIPKVVPVPGAGVGGATRFVGSATGEISDLTGRESILRSRLRDTGRAYKALGKSQFRIKPPLITLVGGAGKASTALKQTSRLVKTTAVVGMNRAGLAIGRAGTALRGLARSGYALIGGPFGLLIGGLFAITMWGDDLGRAIAGGQELIDAQANEFKPKSAKALRKNLEPFKAATNKELEEGQKLFEDFGIEAAKIPGSEFTINQARRARQEQRNQRARQEQDLPAAQLLPDQLEEEVKSLRSFTLGSKKFREQFKRVREEFELADKDADPKGFKEARAKLGALGSKLVNQSILVADSLKGFTKDGREALIKQLDILGPTLAGGPTFAPGKARRRFVGKTQKSVVRDLTEGTAKDRAEAIERLGQASEELATFGKEEFDLAMKFARTQRQRHGAYGNYIDQLRRSQQLIRRQGRTGREDLLGDLAKAEAEVERLERGFPIDRTREEPGGVRQAKLRDSGDRRQKRLKVARAGVRKLNKALDVLDKLQRRQLAEFNAMIREIRLEEVQEDINLLDVRSQIKQVRIGDENPIAQAREGVRAASEALRLLRGAGADDKELANALLTLLQSEADLQDAIADQAEELRDATA
ncbi:MAG: phage tail tape measure protein, partial [Candidatus Glassbacteria bacterium]|nr:phage tail tape measure protein [Candidatus Glassbacteria bacterium]